MPTNGGNKFIRTVDSAECRESYLDVYLQLHVQSKCMYATNLQTDIRYGIQYFSVSKKLKKAFSMIEVISELPKTIARFRPQ
jgi:hypothetical protein